MARKKFRQPNRCARGRRSARSDRSPTNSSSIPAPSGIGQTGWKERTSERGTTIARDQEEISYRLNGNHWGSRMISGGMAGVPRQGYCANSAR